MDTTQRQRRMRIRQVGAAVAATAVFGSITVLGSAASATAPVAEWPPSASISGTADDHTLVVAGSVPQNCMRNDAYIEVRVSGDSLTTPLVGEDRDAGANGGEFSVTFPGLEDDGPYTIVAEVIDGTPANCTEPVDVILYMAPFWTDDVLANGTVDSAYTDGVAATSNPAATYSVTSGSLPDGLTLDSTTGAVTGTPTTEGQSTFTITATDGKDSITKDFVLDVAAAAIVPALSAPVWTDSTMVTALTVGTPYTDDVSATGNPVPTYSVSAGTLPAGLSLDPVTGAITGTPTTAGPGSFTLTASNSEGSVHSDIITSVLSGTVVNTPVTPTEPVTPTKPVTPATPNTPAPTNTVTPVVPAPAPAKATSTAAAPIVDVQDAGARRPGATALAATGSGSGMMATFGSMLVAMGMALAIAGRRRTHQLAPVSVAPVADDDRSTSWGTVALAFVVLALAGRKSSSQA